RIFTPDGTLVVETDDAAVKVTIEGDGGLLITPPGGQQVRLRPGTYQLRATKDGKALRQELITITRGDKLVVRVSRETGGPATALAFEPGWRPPPPGLLDALDPAQIPPAERFDWQPQELVAVLGSHRGRQAYSARCVVFSPDGNLIASSG